MPFSVKTLATINLIVQGVLLLSIFFAAWQAKRKRLIRHCKIINIIVLVQLVSILLVMLPSMLDITRNESLPLIFHIEDWVHHSLGLLTVLLWIYVNLVVRGKIKLVGKLVYLMRTALALWVLVFSLGVHMYLVLTGVVLI